MNSIKIGGKVDTSRIAIGCMRIADKSDKEMDTLLNVATECGYNFFDHADIYGRGKCEEVFGRALKRNPSLKNNMILQTKCGIVPGKMFDFSFKHIIDSVNGSLSRLQVEKVDILLLHRPDALMEPDEINEAFLRLKQEGKVAHFGVSNFFSGQIELLKSRVKEDLIANQLQFSLAFTGLVDFGVNVNMKNDASVMHDGGLLEYCRLHNMTIQAWSPFMFGFFDGVFIDSPKYPALNDKLQLLGKKYGLSKSAIALSWILRHPAVIQPIVGSTNPDRLRDFAKAENVLTREEWYALYLAAGNILP